MPLPRESFIISLYAALVARITPLVCVSIIASLILFSSHRYIAEVPPNGNPTKQGQNAESSSSQLFSSFCFSVIDNFNGKKQIRKRS